MLKKLLAFDVYRSSRGSSSVIILCAAFLIMIAAAILTDIAYAAVENFKLSRGAREVARFGAAELAGGRSIAEKSMKAAAVKIIPDLNDLVISISDTNKEITVKMRKPFEYIFLQYAGFGRKNLSTAVTARLSGIAEYKGVRPFAVERQMFRHDKEYKLGKSNIPDAVSIDCRALDLGGGDYRTTILYGFRNTLVAGSGVYALGKSDPDETVDSIGQIIDKCRHQPQCTYTRYQADCPRIVVLPVVDKLNVTDKETLKVEGFAAFFIENVSMENQNPIIKGRFLRYTVDSRTNDAAADFGLLGVELIN